MDVAVQHRAVSYVHGVIHDEAVTIVRDLSLVVVAELDGPAQTALRDRSSVGFMQRHEPRRTRRGVTADPQTGLRDEATGALDQHAKFFDAHAKFFDAMARCSSRTPPRTQDRVSLGEGRFGQIGQQPSNSKELVDDVRPETARELAGRRLVRDPRFETDATEPAPRQRIVHLNTRLLIPRSEPVLQKQ